MTLADYSCTSSLNRTPGPGAYELDDIRSFGNGYSKKCSIRPRIKDRESSTSKIDYPPMQSSLSKKGFTIGHRTTNKNAEPSPGPSYLPDPNEGFTKSVKIKGGNKKNPKSGRSPGPADYFPQPLPSTSVPTQGSRPPIVLDQIAASPGPAAYDIPPFFGKNAPKLTIRPRTSTSSTRSTDPGYLFNQKSEFGKDSPKWSFPKSSPIPTASQKIPGPGEYDSSETHSSRIGPSIHPLTERKEAEIINVPYVNVRQFPNLRPMTIGSRIESDVWRKDTTIPGPAFLPDSSLELKPIMIRDRFKEKTNQQSPGPSDYEPIDAHKSKANSFSIKGPISRDDWYPIDKAIPGPGQYSINQVNTLPKWTIGERSISRHSTSK